MAERTEPELVTQMDPRVDSLQTAPPSSPLIETHLNGGEQALESHEVIELQTFSDRKAWIEEKIKFLESLPPIEVFAGLEDIKSSSENVSGLPTRLELRRWVAEHDAIEKETEIFDTGELTKLRQLTKAATQRNLSAEDTDVIELTLTTIYELDKLLHLLRDRSENLEMMDIRLTWEENRQSSWKERRQIIEDLGTFCINRARWSPTIYDNPNISAEDSHTITRRSSIASLASAGSDNTINSAAFSRGARFKLAEILSRDAAQFSGRVTALRHGKVAAAGKALDKLIDHSRKPVPEELLDEQDRLEEKSIGEMENISKFIMNMVMQWRKADEIYVETMKDQTAASNLLEEIETAKLYHPTARQSTSFASRIDTILKRLAIRGDPSSPASTFPRPEHLLLPDQKNANGKLVMDLSEDIKSANRLARKVELAARDYRVSYDAVKRAENMQASIVDISSTLSSNLSHLIDGVPSGDGDCSPPNLTNERCLDPQAHSVFLAFLPSLLESTRTSIATADAILRSAPSTLLGLEIEGIDTEFKERVASDVNKLTLLREEVTSKRDLVSRRVSRLRDARKISSEIDSNFASMKNLKTRLIESMKQDHWQERSGELDTPRSPVIQTTPSSVHGLTNVDMDNQLLQINFKIKVDVIEPLELFSASSPDELVTHLKNQVSALQGVAEENAYMLRLLDAVRGQTAVMKSIQSQAHEILASIESNKVEIHNTIERALIQPPNHIEPQISEQSLDFEALQQQVTDFNNNLPHRVIFVDRPLSNPLSALSDFNFLPFDLASLDARVRADSNGYTMKLNGAMEVLKNEQKHLQLVKITKLTDSALITVQNEIDAITQELASKKLYFEAIPRDSIEGINSLQALFDDMILLKAKSSQIGQSLHPITQALQKMDEMSTQLDPVIRERLYLTRNRTLTDSERQIRDCGKEVGRFCDTISNALKDAQRLQEAMAVAEAIRREQEAMRLAAEELERKQLEQMRIQEEEQKRLLEARMEEERQKEQHRQQFEDKLAEERRVAQEAAEVERLAVEELARQAEAAQSERVLKEEVERLRMERERAEMMERLRETEAQLEEERRLHAEHNAAALDLEREMNLQMDLQRKHSEAQRLFEEQQHRRHVEELLKRQADEKQKIQEEDARRIKELEESERRRLVHLEEQINEVTGRQMEKNGISDKDVKNDGALGEFVIEGNAIHEWPSAQRDRGCDSLVEEPGRPYATPMESLNRPQELVLPPTDERPVNKQQDRGDKLHGEKLHRRDQKQHTAGLPKATGEAPVKVSLVKEDKKVPRSIQQPAHLDEPDVFGNHATPNLSTVSRDPENAELRAQLTAFRKRLRSIGIDAVLRSSNASTALPTESDYKKMHSRLTVLAADVQKVSVSAEASEIGGEVRYLKCDIEAAFTSLKGVENLVALHNAIQTCDAALSDMLEHIDSYPAAPLSTMSAHQSLSTDSPEEQLSSRLDFTRKAVAGMADRAASAVDDSRTRSEHSRIQQTWVELEEMANDRLNGNKSRPSSSVSRSNSLSSFSGSTSVTIPPPPPLPPPPAPSAAAKKKSYANLSVSSVSSPSRGKMLAPPNLPSKSRRTTSGTTDTASRSTSRVSSVSSNRSVSGPLSASVYGSTFASRQRTTSLTASIATASRPPTSSSRFRIASESKRVHSPSMSEKSAPSNSRSSLAPSRSSISSSTWSRAPRDSLSSILQRPRVVTPQKKTDVYIRKKYVANPKSKLDMAVGDVVNQLPVGINVEGITETWRDQSGKYWIGNQDPKLCFCRILRSQTVMVRVGGGWTELSKFIQDHFADSFRIAPESPRIASQERWISSATLLESQEVPGSPPRAPQTPEPKIPYVPSFSLMTPSGLSPHSLRSSPSAKGSPLTPLQFMRRADPEHPSTNLLRPVTPSKTPLRGRTSNANTPSRTSVWRP